MRIVADARAYCTTSPFVIWRPTVQCTGPYEVPDVFCESRAAYSNGPLTGAMCGFGSPQINLSHYVLDALTPVHLLTTSSEIHDDFESALDQVAASVLVGPAPAIPTADALAGLRHCRKRKIVSGYDIADEFARQTAAEFADPLREVYPDWQAKGVALDAGRRARRGAGAAAVLRRATDRAGMVYGLLWRAMREKGED